MNERLLCPSMMCANYGHLADEVRALDDAGVDIFHCDIMDGHNSRSFMFIPPQPLNAEFLLFLLSDQF